MMRSRVRQKWCGGPAACFLQGESRRSRSDTSSRGPRGANCRTHRIHTTSPPRRPPGPLARSRRELLELQLQGVPLLQGAAGQASPHAVTAPFARSRRSSSFSSSTSALNRSKCAIGRSCWARFAARPSILSSASRSSPPRSSSQRLRLLYALRLHPLQLSELRRARRRLRPLRRRGACCWGCR